MPKKRSDKFLHQVRDGRKPGGFTGADLAHLLASLPDAPAAYLDAVEGKLRDQPPAGDVRRPRS